MKNIKLLSYDSWNKLKKDFIQDLFGDGCFSRGKYIFRGQSNDSWPLTPSYDRRWNDPEGSIELLNLFKEAVEAAGKQVPDSLEGAIALAQHHGLPTRMLDWSSSPYIAFFFAFSGATIEVDQANPERKVAIWALDTISSIWGEDRGVALVTPAADNNVRMRNQVGMFTLSKTPFSSLEEYSEQFPAQESPSLLKAIVPASEARKALADLDAMKINALSVFGEFDGCSKTALQRFLLSKGGI